MVSGEHNQEINPNIEVLKSFTPCIPARNNAGSPLGNKMEYNKVHQLAADIKVSRKSQPLVDTSMTIEPDNTLYFNQQKLRQSQAHLLMNQTIGSGNAKTDGNSSTIGGATIITVQGNPNKATNYGA